MSRKWREVQVDQLREKLPDCRTDRFTAEAGYFSGENAAYLAERDIDAYIPERSNTEDMEGDDGAGAFASHNFSYDAVTDVLTCPTGKILTCNSKEEAENRT